MTTVVQQPSSATFGPSNDNNSFLGVSVSKMKQKSPTTLSTNLTFNSSQLSKQIAASANVPSTETNGSVSSHNSTSPRPHTTSQVIPCVIISNRLGYLSAHLFYSLDIMRKYFGPEFTQRGP